MIDRIIDDINKALEAEAYMAALSLVLTLPDICAKAEYGKTGKANYINWFDENIGQYEKAPIEPGETEMPHLSGEVVYQLRCSMLHQGTPNIDKKNIKNEPCQIDHFTLVVEKKNSFDIYSDVSSIEESDNYRTYDVNICRLCFIITRCAQAYYNKNKDKFDFFNYDIREVITR